MRDFRAQWFTASLGLQTNEKAPLKTHSFNFNLHMNGERLQQCGRLRIAHFVWEIMLSEGIRLRSVQRRYIHTQTHRREIWDVSGNCWYICFQSKLHEWNDSIIWRHLKVIKMAIWNFQLLPPSFFCISPVEKDILWAPSNILGRWSNA